MISERRIIYRHVDEPGYTTDLACYQRAGGYEVLRKAILRKTNTSSLRDLERIIAISSAMLPAAL